MIKSSANGKSNKATILRAASFEYAPFFDIISVCAKLRHSTVFRLLNFFICAGILAAQTPAKEQTPHTLRTKLIATAKQYVGVPYRYGGLTVSGMDCSGFIYTVAREAAGVQLPRTADAMYSFCRIVPDAKREPGDIVFFRSGGTKITHAGIYIGNNQFIHAVSDGPNTGVIVSSLNQTTWKQKYAGCGQFLPASPVDSESPTLSAAAEKTTENAARPSAEAGSNTQRAASTSSNEILAGIRFGFSGNIRWTLYTADRFGLILRGAGFQTHIHYEGKILRPGIIAEFRLEPLMHAYQFPVLFTLGFPRGFYLYAGPVFTAGKPHLIGKEDPLSAPIFPGIFGVGWQSPALQVEKSRISFIQDVSWTVFTKTDKTRLDFKNGAASGFGFSTGIRVTISAKDLFN